MHNLIPQYNGKPLAIVLLAVAIMIAAGAGLV